MRRPIARQHSRGNRQTNASVQLEHVGLDQLVDRPQRSRSGAHMIGHSGDEALRMS
jgi:hypothetical protein